MSRFSSAINFQQEVGAGGELVMRHEFEQSGLVSRIYATAVLGEEADVRRFFELKKNATDRMNLIESATDGPDTGAEYLAGDDQKWRIPVAEEFSAGDVLQMRVNNTDANNAYPNNAFVSVQFEEVTQ